ncbi:MAG: hypothetical protein V7L29_16590, partial [Nostoc sp.]|uniref:hypothetical protein n=1 Tax=Nostoc sp. TaxID=1180 RepID=UPI002FF4F742
ICPPLPILGEGLGVRVKPGKFAKSSFHVKLTPMAAKPLQRSGSSMPNAPKRLMTYSEVR